MINSNIIDLNFIDFAQTVSSDYLIEEIARSRVI